MKNIVTAANAPAAIGPYSQAAEHQGVIYVSGQLPLDPATGALCQGDIQSQTRLILTNISHILEAGGSSLANVLKATILLKDRPTPDSSRPIRRPASAIRWPLCPKTPTLR